jgi:hypothetical protein
MVAKPSHSKDPAGAAKPAEPVISERATAIVRGLVCTERAALGVDAAHFYLMDINVARTFVKRFACGLAVVQRVT